MMGSKKHKKHKSERKDRLDDRQFSLERPPGLKLILKVGGNSSTPEHSNDSPGPFYSGGMDESLSDMSEKHKKAKKKKKKKDREKKHKHHHKDKRRRRDDSSQDETSMGEESLLEPPKLLHINQLVNTTEENTEAREPRQCVLRQRQERSPLALLLEHLLRALEKRDVNQFFAWPVTDNIAPGYSTIISQPMDFSTMKQKIDDGVYRSMMEFTEDFKLMCENALRYNHADTVYHKAAKKLLHVGSRLLQPDKLRALRPLLAFMSDIPTEQLGFEIAKPIVNELAPVLKIQVSEPMDTTPIHVLSEVDDAPSPASTAEPVEPEMDIEEKRRLLRIENWPKSKFEPFVDDLTPQEILEQAQNAAKSARQRLLSKRCPNNLGFLRQHKDGTTSMKILLDSGEEGPERPISLGAFIGKLSQGTGQLQGFREDRRNLLKPVKALDYGQFSSFAPIYDSRFANLTTEETQLVLQTYGDETGAQYADSILEFTKDSPYASSLAGNLLDLLTSGEHRKTYNKIQENQKQRAEQKELEKLFIDNQQQIENSSMEIDLESLRSLSDLGIDISFLETLEKEAQQQELAKQLQGQLDNNAQMLERLQQAQSDRLSLPLPQHLSQLQQPSSNELTLASQISTNLTNMARKVNPGDVAPVPALRKAMGIGDRLPTMNMETQMSTASSPVQKSIGSHQMLDVEEETAAFSVMNHAAIISQNNTLVPQNPNQVRPVRTMQSNISNMQPRTQNPNAALQGQLRSHIISGNVQKQIPNTASAIQQQQHQHTSQLMAVRGPRVLQRPMNTQNAQIAQQNMLINQQNKTHTPQPVNQQIVNTNQQKPRVATPQALQQNQQTITTQSQNVQQLLMQQQQSATANQVRQQLVPQQRVVQQIQRPIIRAQQQAQQIRQQAVQQLNQQQQRTVRPVVRMQQQQSPQIVTPQTSVRQPKVAQQQIQVKTVQQVQQQVQQQLVQQAQQQALKQQQQQHQVIKQQQVQQHQLVQQVQLQNKPQAQQTVKQPVVQQQVNQVKHSSGVVSATVSSGSTPPTIHISAQTPIGVDLESELREYLESGGVLSADQDATIAQILME